MNQTILVITVLACVAFSITEGAAIFIQPRCKCTGTQKTQIKTEKIQNFVSIAPGPHCKRLQVIATVKHRHMEVEVCVNPNHKWVKEAMAKLEQKKSKSTTVPPQLHHSSTTAPPQLHHSDKLIQDSNNKKQ
ncbi:interleukin-8-like [Astyanax mexicanus]|uniref:interleukin-8-like n=1 Tax=Astyanax mexicanus TaxID=7994 RepID=UPI0020CB5B39|nr:interleukin-8-like [Astyanax mexicanus]